MSDEPGLLMTEGERGSVSFRGERKKRNACHSESGPGAGAVDEGMNVTHCHPERRGWAGGKRRACPERSEGISSCTDALKGFEHHRNWRSFVAALLRMTAFSGRPTFSGRGSLEAARGQGGKRGI